MEASHVGVQQKANSEHVISVVGCNIEVSVDTFFKVVQDAINALAFRNNQRPDASQNPGPNKGVKQDDSKLAPPCVGIRPSMLEMNEGVPGRSHLVVFEKEDTKVDNENIVTITKEQPCMRTPSIILLAIREHAGGTFDILGSHR
jgi:hypothetical protein